MYGSSYAKQSLRTGTSGLPYLADPSSVAATESSPTSCAPALVYILFSMPMVIEPRSCVEACLELVVVPRGWEKDIRYYFTGWQRLLTPERVKAEAGHESVVSDLFDTHAQKRSQ